jgi:heterotetrameric sarcosine oxidase delta subunit
VTLLITCPRCGRRPYTEFSFGGELRVATIGDEEATANFERVWLRENLAGPQRERWFHRDGCRRWLTLERDTTTNEIRDGT